MSEDKKKRNKIVGISIGIFVVLLVVISSTYAYWQVTKSQNDPNSIVAACLDITMENQSGTLTPSENFPISDADGLKDSGFTFTVENHCEEDVAYIIGLDSVEVDTTGTNGYMLDGSIKVSIDNTTPRIFGKLPEIDHIESKDTYVIRNSRKINTAVVPGKKGDEPGKDTHTIKAWIDADAPLSENNKVFGGRVFITGGQYITDDNPIAKPTDESCFTMNGEEIIGYDESCGTSVTIPMYVGENAVTTIDSNAFKATSTTETYYDMSNNEISSIDKSSAIVAVVLQNHEKGTAPDLANLFTNFDYAISYTDDADTNSTIQGMVGERPLYYQNSTTQDFPGFKNKDLVIYMSDLSGSMLGMEYIELVPYVSINELDLSQAYNLELIEPRAFSNFDAGLSDNGDITAEIEKNEVSLTSLIFGKPNDKLIIGYGAFNGINVDNLTMYSNIIAMGYSEIVNYENEYTAGFFVGAQIDNLTIEYIKGYENIGSLDESGFWAQLFSSIISQNIIIGEGITTLNKAAFNKIGDTAEIKNITLPSTITYLDEYSLENVQNVTFAAGHCNNVQIEDNAWSSEAVVTPSTCVLGQNIE